MLKHFSRSFFAKLAFLVKLAFLAKLALLFAFCSQAYSRTSLGIGVAEPGPPKNGPFLWLFGQIHVWQKYFEQMVTETLVAMRDNPSAGLWLIFISFVYGILHAAGPGHGKAVIASYLIAHDETLKRGIILSFLSSLLQAFSAIVIIAVIFFLIPGSWTETAHWVTFFSFALITLLGLWMLSKTTRQLLRSTASTTSNYSADHALSLPNTQNPAESQRFPGMKSNAPRLNYKTSAANAPHINQGAICNVCGKAHITDAALLTKPLNWKTALSTILSVGLRPCTGALFIMSFAVVSRLYYAGIASVVAMSIGTFITVSILATLAVKAKSLALKIFQKKVQDSIIKIIIEWLAALFILLTGLSLLISSLF